MTVLLGGVALVDGERVLAAMADAASVDAAQETTAAQGVGTFTAADVAFLDEIAETILPETNTPGAKAARTGAFMALMVTDAYTPRHQQIFRDGMRQMDEACQREYGASFIQARPEQRLALLQRLDAERQAELDALDALQRSRAPVAPPPPPDAPVHYFRLMKELALSATSRRRSATGRPCATWRPPDATIPARRTSRARRSGRLTPDRVVSGFRPVPWRRRLAGPSCMSAAMVERVLGER